MEIAGYYCYFKFHTLCDDQREPSFTKVAFFFLHHLMEFGGNPSYLDNIYRNRKLGNIFRDHKNIWFQNWFSVSCFRSYYSARSFNEHWQLTKFNLTVSHNFLLSRVTNTAMFKPTSPFLQQRRKSNQITANNFMSCPVSFICNCSKNHLSLRNTCSTLIYQTPQFLVYNK